MRAGVGQEDCKLYILNIKKMPKKIEYISDAQEGIWVWTWRHFNGILLMLQAQQRFGKVSYILTKSGIHSSQKRPSRHAKQDWDLA